MQNNKRIVVSGSPGGGKTSLIEGLKKNGYTTFEEYSRTVIQAGQKAGTANLFTTSPMRFSEELLKGRKEQFEQANHYPAHNKVVFYDRGIHDTYAYLQAIGKATPAWEKHVYKYQYDLVFLVTPWRDIYTKDAQRLETFEQAEMYYPFIKEVYSKQHKIIEVPQLNILERISFIESYIKFYG
ncbi:MAG: ATP-binding protein [Flavobacteriaceae bacterium]|nr:ATP-binding protein [Flavobacteriaceae bacterium]MDG1920684.1 ATP-binding protein [Flavobacteriaceae bacterium]